jgi:hypothetical protein
MANPVPPPKDYVSPQERLAGQDWSGVAKTGIASMTPGDKGWVLAVVIIIAILQGADYFSSVAQVERFEAGMSRMADYLELIEQDRRQVQLARTDERQELIRIIEALTQTVTRQANRDGRAETANQAVSNALKAQAGEGGE